MIANRAAKSPDHKRQYIIYLACLAAYPLTLLEGALMSLVAVLSYWSCRFVYLGFWYPEQRRRRPVSTVKQKIDVENALEVMQTLERIGDESRARVFWISGTLLGLERLGHPLPHDTDLDVGIFIDDPHYQDFIRALGQSSEIVRLAPQFVSLKARIQNPDLHVVPDGIIRYKSLVRNATAPDKPPIKTDIFLHFPYRGGSMHGSRNTLWWNSPFEAVQRPCGDGHFSVPGNAHLYLTENYGSYRNEVKDFENSIDCPNAMNIFSWRSLAYLLRCQQVMLKLGRINRAHQVNMRVAATILKGLCPLWLRQPRAQRGS